MWINSRATFSYPAHALSIAPISQWAIELTSSSMFLPVLVKWPRPLMYSKFKHLELERMQRNSSLQENHSPILRPCDTILVKSSAPACTHSRAQCLPWTSWLESVIAELWFLWKLCRVCWQSGIIRLHKLFFFYSVVPRVDELIVLVDTVYYDVLRRSEYH